MTGAYLLDCFGCVLVRSFLLTNCGHQDILNNCLSLETSLIGRAYNKKTLLTCTNVYGGVTDDNIVVTIIVVVIIIVVVVVIIVVVVSSL